MADKVSELKQKRVALLAEARAILETAEKESRSTSAEENQEYDRIGKDLDALEATIHNNEDLQERQRSLARASEGNTEQRSNVEDRSYEKVFDKYLRQGMQELDREERSLLRSNFRSGEKRADMLESVDNHGGYLVPVNFHNTLVNRLEQASAIRSAGATVLSTGGGSPILIPKVVSHAAGQGPLAEGAGPTADSDVFDQIQLGAFKFGALVKVSVELLEDNGVNLEEYLANELGRKVGRLAGDKWAAGAGTTEPLGLFVDAPTGATATGTTALATDDILNLIYSVEPQYRNSPNTAFILNDAVIASLRKIKWNIGSDPVGYAWQPSIQVGQPDRLFGYPVYSDPAAPGTIAAADTVAVFGDISRFYIRDAGGVNFVRLNERYMDTMMVGFMAWIRTDSALVDDNAVKKLVMHA